MDSDRSEDMFPSRGISPTMRSGPRQKRSDANADEIIRFVREHQRVDLPKRASISSSIDTSSNGPSLKRKSVLPAIGGRSSHGDVMHLHNSYKTIEDNQMFPPDVPDTAVNVSVTDSGFVDKGSDPHDSNSEDNSNNYNYNESLDINVDDDDDDDDIIHDDDFIGLEKVDPFKYKQGIIIARGRNGNIIDCDEESKPLNPRDVFVEDQLLSSRTRRSSKVLDNLLNNGSSKNNRNLHQSYLSEPNGLSQTFSNGVSKVGNLRRPRALPQLPPITKNDIPARPSAPSPSVTPPLPESPLVIEPEPDNFRDIFTREGEICNDNVGSEANSESHFDPSLEPVDYIDCP